MNIEDIFSRNLENKFLIIEDKYNKQEFPEYQMNILNIITLEPFKIYDELYTCILHGNIIFQIKDLFTFSINFMKEMLKSNENNINILRTNLGKKFYDDNIIEEEDKIYFNIRYKVNMQNCDSYSEVKEIFFFQKREIERKSNTPDYTKKEPLYNKIILLNKSRNRNEADLNFFIVSKYNDIIKESKNIQEISNNLKFLLSYIDIKIRKDFFHFVFIQMKNPIHLTLMNIEKWGKLLTNENFSIFKNILSDLDTLAPFTFKYNLYYNLKKMK